MNSSLILYFKSSGGDLWQRLCERCLPLDGPKLPQGQEGLRHWRGGARGGARLGGDPALRWLGESHLLRLERRTEMRTGCSGAAGGILTCRRERKRNSLTDYTPSLSRSARTSIFQDPADKIFLPSLDFASVKNDPEIGAVLCGYVGPPPRLSNLAHSSLTFASLLLSHQL